MAVWRLLRGRHVGNLAVIVFVIKRGVSWGTTMLLPLRAAGFSPESNQAANDQSAFSLGGFLSGFASFFFLGQALMLGFLRLFDVRFLKFGGWFWQTAELIDDVVELFLGEYVLAVFKAPHDGDSECACALNNGEIRSVGRNVEFRADGCECDDAVRFLMRRQFEVATKPIDV